MKKYFILVFAGFLSLFVTAQAQNDELAIKSLIDKAYVEAIHNNGDLEEARKGFHPGFDLLIIKNNMLEKLPIYNWIQSAAERRVKNPESLQNAPTTLCKYLNFDIVGDAAIVKLELWRNNEKIFTDWLSLYQFEDGWKIVGKIYYRHPAVK
ncbi:MAG: nuclear transport factor 2 family protein [Bacteroidales bacterium]|jgi:hypothetical protein|nr:nuclear transport factor 2 family protein [Bacteroidales bacterium]